MAGMDIDLAQVNQFVLQWFSLRIWATWNFKFFCLSWIQYTTTCLPCIIRIEQYNDISSVIGFFFLGVLLVIDCQENFLKMITQWEFIANNTVFSSSLFKELRQDFHTSWCNIYGYMHLSLIHVKIDNRCNSYFYYYLLFVIYPTTKYHDKMSQHWHVTMGDIKTKKYSRAKSGFSYCQTW